MMNAVDVLLMAGILLALGLAVRKCVRDHRAGKGCGGNCAQCGHRCGK